MQRRVTLSINSELIMEREHLPLYYRLHTIIITAVGLIVEV